MNKKKEKEKNIIPYEQKEEFLDINKNRLINIFSKYQNSLVKDEGKNLYMKKKVKSMKKSRSNISPKLISKNYQYESQQFNPYFSFRTKNKNKKEIYINSNKDNVINLFDENYVYDEDDFS